MCAIFDKKIKNIESVAEQLIPEKDTILVTLSKILGVDMMSTQEVNYDSEEIGFKVVSELEGAVALVLKFAQTHCYIMLLMLSRGELWGRIAIRTYAAPTHGFKISYLLQHFFSCLNY